METKKHLGLITLLFLLSLSLNAQHNFFRPSELYTEMPDTIKNNIIHSLNDLFENIAAEKNYDNLLDKDNLDFNRNYFQYLGYIVKPDTTANYPHPQILNLYKHTGDNKYSITLAYSSLAKKKAPPTIHGIYTFTAKKENEKFVFSTPLNERTKAWKSKRIDEITFYYPDTLNTERAASFVKKNKSMATKLGLPIKHFDTYVVNNYQESLFLLGIDYAYGENGIINNGYIIDPKTLFSVMGNEDFSHDVLHIYAQHIRDKRNVTAEEGLAYTWGDAYYADSNGYIPSQKSLIIKLRQYIESHPEETLLDIFNRNPRIFEYTPKISPKSVISGAICDEIERVKGNSGIIELLRCGQGDDNYFECIHKLIAVNRVNFNERVLPLIMKE